MVIERKFFISIILILVPLFQVFPQEERPTTKLTLMELAIKELDSAVKSATTQEDLAKKAFDAMQNAEYISGLNFSEEIIPPLLENVPEFNNVFDLMEEKWLSFPADDYYDEVGILLLYGNIMAGRFEKADVLFMKMKGNMTGRHIDPYFNDNYVMEAIYRINFCKKLFVPLENLSVIYVAKMGLKMYGHQENWDKFWEAMELILDNCKGTRGAELLGALDKYRKAKLKYGSKESIPTEERKQLEYNLGIADEEVSRCED